MTIITALFFAVPHALANSMFKVAKQVVGIRVRCIRATHTIHKLVTVRTGVTASTKSSSKQPYPKNVRTDAVCKLGKNGYRYQVLPNVVVVLYNAEHRLTVLTVVMVYPSSYRLCQKRKKPTYGLSSSSSAAGAISTESTARRMLTPSFLCFLDTSPGPLDDISTPQKKRLDKNLRYIIYYLFGIDYLPVLNSRSVSARVPSIRHSRRIAVAYCAMDRVRAIAARS